MLQDVDLADGQPMFLKIGGREIVVMDAEPFRAMQDAALSARPDSDMVERVGMAIYSASGDNKWGAFSRARYDNIARAAIAAMGSADMGKEGESQ